MKSVQKTSLFDLSSDNKDNKKPDKKQTTKKPRQKKTEPKPIIEEPIKQKQRKPVAEKKPESKQKKETKQKSTTTIQSTPIKTKPMRGWKSFEDKRPDKMIPLEFYVDTGSDKQDIFNGYISEENLTCTNEPFKLVVLRRKYGNLYYREISGCSSIYECPNYFPDCKSCKKGRDRK